MLQRASGLVARRWNQAEKWRAMGTTAADAVAVRAKEECHPTPSRKLAREVSKQRKQQLSVARVIGEVLALWPIGKPRSTKLPVHGPRRVAQPRAIHAHVWRRRGERYVCRVCLKNVSVSVSEDAKRRVPRSSPALARILAQPQEHRLAAGSVEDDVLLVCVLWWMGNAQA